MSEQFVVKQAKNRLYITADEASIKSLVFVLDSLVDLSRAIKNKAEIARARERIKNRKLELQRIAKAKEFSDLVKARYQEHLNNGCCGNKKAAFCKTRLEFGLLSVDLKYIIRNSL